ncbi:MAG TPA: translation initiation factor IF-2 subunit beta [archaeon]|nr:translation initiation factor IF-2 subunit beta [archaeon]
MEYDQLLERAMEKVPKEKGTGERFEMPKCQLQPAGLKTIIVNFADIVAALRRDEKHFLKFLLKELATSGVLTGKQLTIIGRFPNITIDKKIESYVNQFVICKDCTRPDTQIVKDDRLYFLKCEACGSKYHIPTVGN